MGELDLPEGRIAVVGMAKNCGKTTTLNRIAASLHEEGTRAGLLSIGIDGEASDVLIGTPKPPVRVSEGQCVVTADAALTQSSARWEWLDALGIRTPLGEAVVARCLAPGDLVLGGLRHRADVGYAAGVLLEKGCTHVLIDGAYGRISAAAPGTSDAVVVATGAIVADTAQSLADATEVFLRRLQLPQVTDPALHDMATDAEARGVVLIGPGPVELESSSALLGLQRERAAWQDDHDSIAIPGLVSDGVVDELLALGRAGTLVVPDATSLHCSNRHFRRLVSKWRVEVLRPITVAGVAINPTSITGARIDARQFADLLHESVADLTVFNPAVGLHSVE